MYVEIQLEVYDMLEWLQISKLFANRRTTKHHTVEMSTVYYLSHMQCSKKEGELCVIGETPPPPPRMLFLMGVVTTLKGTDLAMSWKPLWGYPQINASFELICHIEFG